MSVSIPANLEHRLLYILHRGFVEARLLARQPERAEQLHDLADAMEVIPSWMSSWCSEEHLRMVRFVLEDYEKKHPGAFEYAVYLGDREAPRF